MGYTPNLVAGVYIGFDNPTPMGHGATGGGLAAPVFNDFMKAALKDSRPADFRMPDGYEADRDRPQDRHGHASRRQERHHGSIQAGHRSLDIYSVIGLGDGMASGAEITDISPQATRAVTTGAGGLY